MSPRICFIPSAFLVKLDIEHSKVIEIIAQYSVPYLDNRFGEKQITRRLNHLNLAILTKWVQ